MADNNCTTKNGPPSFTAPGKIVGATMACRGSRKLADSSTEDNPLGQLRSSKKAVQSADAVAAGDSQGPPATLCSSGFVPTWSPGAARTEECGLLKKSGIAPKELCYTQPTDVSTSMNCTGGLSNATPASPPHNAGTSGQTRPSLNENCTGGLSDSSTASSPDNGTSSAHAVCALPNKGAADFLGKSHEACPVSGGGSSYDHPHVMEREMKSSYTDEARCIHSSTCRTNFPDSAKWSLPRELTDRHPTTVATPMNSLFRSPINQVDSALSLVCSLILLLAVFVAWLWSHIN